MHVILPVPICIKDEFFLGRGKPTAQCRPITAVTRVMDNAQLTVRLCQRIELCARSIGASVINNNYFEVGSECR